MEKCLRFKTVIHRPDIATQEIQTENPNFEILCNTEANLLKPMSARSKTQHG